MEDIINYKKYIIFIIALLTFNISSLHAGGSNLPKNKHKISIKPREFFWAISHPFIAKKVLKLTKIAIKITDSLEKNKILSDKSGGNLDAFKHSYWMALLSQNIKSKKAYRLGVIHEKINYHQYKRNCYSQDSTASLMDLKNNEVGISYGEKYKEISKNELIEIIISAIRNGELYRLKKDKHGNYLDCDDNIIDIKKEKAWNKRKCIEKTN